MSSYCGLYDLNSTFLANPIAYDTQLEIAKIFMVAVRNKFSFVQRPSHYLVLRNHDHFPHLCGFDFYESFSKYECKTEIDRIIHFRQGCRRFSSMVTSMKIGFSSDVHRILNFQNIMGFNMFLAMISSSFRAYNGIRINNKLNRMFELFSQQGNPKTR